MAEDEVKSTNGFKLVFDWDKIVDEYKELMPAIDINKITMPMPSYYCGISSDLNHTSTIVDRDICDGICSVSSTATKFEEIEHKLEKLEEANDIMRTDSKAMAESLVMRENKIKELEAENSKLKEKIEELVDAIEYCKKNGIWANKPVMTPFLRAVCPCSVKSDNEYDEMEHLFDYLEMDNEDEN